MGKVIGFEIKIDGIQTVIKDVGQLEQALGGLTDEMNELKIDQKENEQLFKLGTKTRKEFNKETGRIIKSTAELRQKKQQLNLATRNVIKSEKAEAGSINELAARYNLLVQRIRNTSTATKAGQKRFNELTKQAKQTSDQLKKLEASYGSNTRNVGNYSSALKGLGTQLLGAFGIVGGLTLLATGLKKAVSIGREFEAGTSRLQAITQATNEELKKLTDTAKKLGETTFFTATEVLGLQTELAKLGFTTTQIIDAQAAILDLALITGKELSESAVLAGVAVRGFNLQAEDTRRVVDVMAKSFSSSALDFDKFSNAIDKVAPTAVAFGFTIEETTALLGQLTNAGFAGQRAAVALRKILLNLADAGGDLSLTMGTNVRTFDGFIDGLVNIRESGIDLNETLELTDVRSIDAFQAFLRTAEGARVLRDSLLDVDDFASDAATTIGDNLVGELKKLSSEMEGLVLKEGEGFNEFLRGAVNFARNLAFQFSNFGTTLELMRKNISPFLDVFDDTELVDFLLKLPSVRDEFTKFNKLNFTEITDNLEEVRTEFMLLAQTGEELQLTVEESEKLFDRFFINKFVEYDKTIEKTALSLEDYNAEMDKVFENFVLLSGQNAPLPETITNFATLNQEIKDLKDEQSQLDLSTEGGRKKFRELQESIKGVNNVILELKTSLGLIKEKDLPETTGAVGLLADEFESIFGSGAIDNINRAADAYIKALFRIKTETELITEGLFQPPDEETGETDPEQTLSLFGKLFNITDDDAAVLANKVQFAVQTISEGINIIAKVSADATERRIRDLEEQLNIGIITEEEFIKRREVIQRKAFKQQKKLQILQAVANTALGITQAAAVSNVDPFGINRSIQIAIVAALGAAQVAAIAAQKFKKGGQIPFEEGGKITGASHEQGGVKFQAQGRLMEAEGGEVILNTAQQARLGGRDTFKAIGVPGFRGGGKVPHMLQNGGILGDGVSASTISNANLANAINDQVIQVVNNAVQTQEQITIVENIETNFSTGSDVG